MFNKVRNCITDSDAILIVGYKVGASGRYYVAPFVCWHTPSRHPLLLKPLIDCTPAFPAHMADRNHRWSDVIPPHTALSFAALWDPEEGMVTFTGGLLLDSDTDSSTTLRDVPRDAYDGQSTVFSFDGLTLPLSNSVMGNGGRTRVPTVTFAFNALDDAHSALDPFFGSPAERRLHSQTQKQRQPTANFDWSQVRSVGRTIYTLARTPLDRGIFHSNKENTSGTDSSSSDDGFFEEVPLTAGTFTSAPVLVNLNLKSTFSMTTTSTTGYVDIDTPSVYSYTSTIQVPPPSEAWSTLQGLDFGSSPNTPAPRGRRLQKPRRGLHVLIPADPEEVLARPDYNHVAEQQKPSTSDDSTYTHARDALQARPCLRKFKSLPKLPRVVTPTRASPKASTTPTETLASDSIASPTIPLRRNATDPILDTLISTCPSAVPSSPTRSGGCGRPQLRRQKSMAKVVIDSVGRLTSRCRPAKASSAVNNGGRD